MLLQFPGFPSVSRSPWPVWRGSIAGPVRFVAPSKRDVGRWWRALRRWSRRIRRQLGRIVLDVYEALAWDFLNWSTGRLDPSLDRIAEAAGCSRRSVKLAINVLRDLGVISWVRRCEADHDEEGRFRLRQRTNAYALLPISQWVGYVDDAAPAPTRDTLGYPEPVPDPIEAAVEEITHGQRKAAVAALASGDALATALAGLGRAVEEQSTGVQPLPRNHTPESIDPMPPADADPEMVKRYWVRRVLDTS